MKLIASLSIARPGGEPGLLWPRGVHQLVVVVWQLEPQRDGLVAIDPDDAHGTGRILHTAELHRRQLSAFLVAVIEGHDGELDRHCHKLTAITSEHLLASDPGHLLLQVSLGAARSLRAGERLAEAVVTPSPAHKRTVSPDPSACR
jgi:hypothetical protein